MFIKMLGEKSQTNHNVSKIKDSIVSLIKN